MVTDTAREEAYQLHVTNSNGTPEAHLAGPTAEPYWDASGGGMCLLEDYSLVQLGRALKGEAKEKSSNKIQEIEQKPKEDPSEFLERIYHAQRCYNDADPEAPENTGIVNLILFGQSPSDIKEKFAKIRWYIWNKSFSGGGS